MIKSVYIRFLILKYCVKQFWYLARINYKEKINEPTSKR